MKKMIFILTFLSVAGCTNSVSTYYEYTDNIYNVDHFRNSVVALVNTENDRVSQPFCSGFFVSPRRIATALHCVQQDNEQVIELSPGINFYLELESSSPIGNEILLVTWSGQDAFVLPESLGIPTVTHARVKAIDEENDIAILELDSNESSSEHWLRIANAVNTGERAFALGMPRGQFWILSRGIVSAVQRYLDNTMRIFHQNIIAPGSSGSPVVNNSGEVIGVTIEYIPSIPNLAVASPPHALQTLLDSLQ